MGEIRLHVCRLGGRRRGEREREREREREGKRERGRERDRETPQVDALLYGNDNGAEC